MIAQSGSIASLNPIRYRGYYYDTETGLYYLGSWYYDPQVKRFINADGATGLGAGTQAIASGVISAANNIVSAKVSGQKVKWSSVAIDAIAGAASSLIGSAATKKAAVAAEKQIQRGVRRVVSAKTRYDSGSRFWKGAAKRGLELIQRGNRAMNTARGKASVIGSGISGAFSLFKCSFVSR